LKTSEHKDQFNNGRMKNIYNDTTNKY